MNQAEIIKDYIIYLYKHHPNIHVNIHSKQKLQPVQLKNPRVGP